MNRARCTLCGLMLPTEERGVCVSCQEESVGMCTDCYERQWCEIAYRAAARREEIEGRDPPLYPPCVRLAPPTSSVPPFVERYQQRMYDLPVCGIVAIILASEGGSISDRYQSMVDLESGLRAIAERWGAHWRR